MLLIDGAPTFPLICHKLEASASEWHESMQMQHGLYAFKVWTDVRIYTYELWLLVFGEGGCANTLSHPHTHHKLHASHSDVRKNIWGMAFDFVLTHLSSHLLALIRSTLSPAVIVSELELPVRETWLYQSHNTPTLSSDWPIYTQSVRLVFSHWKCL